jgi:hypothetical protein
VTINISDSIHDKEQQNIYTFIEIKIEFEVIGLELVVKQTAPNNLEVADKLILTLNQISISTLRGVVFSHLKGTPLSEFYMPIFDPRQFLPIKVEPLK